MITAEKRMVKKKTTPSKTIPEILPEKTFRITIPFILLLIFAGIIGIGLAAIYRIYQFEQKYSGKIYPGVTIDGISFEGKTPEDVKNYFQEKTNRVSRTNFTLLYDSKTATVSATDLASSYDGELAATQAYSVGRNGNLLGDTYRKWQGITGRIPLISLLRYNDGYLNEMLQSLAEGIDVAPQDALFQFEKGKVTTFRTSSPGKKLDTAKTKDTIVAYLEQLGSNDNPPASIPVNLPVEPVEPRVTTENSNQFGITELLAVGSSKFAGSIAGRVHNIELAASKLNGRLIAPGETFSFNDAIGDISAATGYQPAYIIKEGRTVLGDGGGVCQVSTTLFRAAMKTGLPIVERNAHAYRVSYYEQDSGPGLDATVYSPSYDLKFTNDTPNYILIQTKLDIANYSLAFEMYGKNDGRKAEISKPVILSQMEPPPDLNQDDPTLPKGTVKQVDWKAWGARVTFDYTVTRGGEEIFKKTYLSNYKPWQAVFLHGTKE